MSHTAITLTCGPDLRDILVAQLSDAGFEGFEETGNALIAYIPETAFDETALRAITDSYGVTYAKDSIQQANWNAVWESNFQPVQVGDFCGIRAAFHPPFSGPLQHEIVITPKMSFGTGHHATTSSMIRLMQDVDMQGRRVFDFGTGTGILAILAAKMGAAAVDAIDIDSWAVENAQENVAANDTSAVKVWQADTPEHINDTYNVLLANINRNILLTFMGDMRRLLMQNGLLLLSGILKEDAPVILAAAEAAGLEQERLIEQDNWLAIRLIAR